MSASLVGSEMCIRDRSSRALKAPRWCALAWRTRSRSPGKSTSPSQCSVTVSYTHLTLPTICSV
eukprot:7270974-Alexandrium_andersonii.AAC.1